MMPNDKLQLQARLDAIQRSTTRVKDNLLKLQETINLLYIELDKKCVIKDNNNPSTGQLADIKINVMASIAENTALVADLVTDVNAINDRVTKMMGNFFRIIEEPV